MAKKDMERISTLRKMVSVLETEDIKLGKEKFGFGYESEGCIYRKYFINVDEKFDRLCLSPDN